LPNPAGAEMSTSLGSSEAPERTSSVSLGRETSGRRVAGTWSFVPSTATSVHLPDAQDGTGAGTVRHHVRHEREVHGHVDAETQTSCSSSCRSCWRVPDDVILSDPVAVQTRTRKRGESVEDLLGALVPGNGSGVSFQG
jgi:hypothetical protein